MNKGASQNSQVFEKAIETAKEQYEKWAKYRTPFSSLDNVLLLFAILHSLEGINTKLENIKSCHCQDQEV